jgi:hypothetical protein
MELADLESGGIPSTERARTCLADWPDTFRMLSANAPSPLYTNALLRQDAKTSFELALLVPVVLLGCDSQEESTSFTRLGPDPWPEEGFQMPPEESLKPGSLIIKPANMTSFYDHPCEAGYTAMGRSTDSTPWHLLFRRHMRMVALRY